jgi:hypothetical protein
MNGRQRASLSIALFAIAWVQFAPPDIMCNHPALRVLGFLFCYFGLVMFNFAEKDE